jgi:hypothetical protein
LNEDLFSLRLARFLVSMTKRERGEIIRARFFAKGGRLPERIPGGQPKEQLRGWLRIWSDNVFSDSAASPLKWVHQPLPKPPTFKDRNARPVSPLTVIADRWDERKLAPVTLPH